MAKQVPIDFPTMHTNLTGQTADELNYAIRHKFGHALGLNHEHQPPDHTVKWNVKKVVEDAAKLGINEAETDANILTVLDRDTPFVQLMTKNQLCTIKSCHG